MKMKMQKTFLIKHMNYCAMKFPKELLIIRIGPRVIGRKYCLLRKKNINVFKNSMISERNF